MADNNVVPITGRDDTASLTLGEIVAELKQLMDSTPDGTWLWNHHSFGDDSEAMLAWLFEQLAQGDSPAMHGVAIDGEMVCVMGNGTHARMYARMVMLMRAVLPFMLQIVERACDVPLPPEDKPG